MNGEELPPLGDEPDGWETCDYCHGEGVIVVCVDDICRGMGECMHGDGEAICPECHGVGEIALTTGWENWRSSMTAIGRIVHYTFPRGQGGPEGQERPAIVVRVFPGSDSEMVQLQVFTDTDLSGTYNDAIGPLVWRTSIPHGTGDGQWHYHEECPAARA